MIPIYMIVTTDEYEFPLYWNESIESLAKRAGVRFDSLRRAFAKSHMGRTVRSKYKKVWIEEDI